MKLKNKIITVLFTLALLLALCVFSISAESGEKVDTGIRQSEITEQSEDGSSELAGDANVLPEAPTEGDASTPATFDEDGTSTETEENEDASRTEGNIFDDIYAGFMKYSSEIMSLLAFVGSIILAIAYKLGLSPLIEKTLSGVLGAIGKLKENVALSEENAEKVSAALTERLESAERVITELNGAVAKMSTAIDTEKANVKWNEQIKTVLTAQIDMLYDIFMTSALPQYQKDAVGERVQSMRSVLVGGDERNDVYGVIKANRYRRICNTASRCSTMLLPSLAREGSRGGALGLYRIPDHSVGNTDLQST